ncbi:anaphase-promoting complex subunit 2 [Ranunculus cassubicifolius]
MLLAYSQAVPLQLLCMLLSYLGEPVRYDRPSSGLKSPLASNPSSIHPGTDIAPEELVRWQLRLDYFAYETLQDLRIAKLFEIIVDYPDSSPAIEDLKQCLTYTGQHTKLVNSFISSLRYRLLTAGASTNDILHQYVSTINGDSLFLSHTYSRNFILFFLQSKSISNQQTQSEKSNLNI